MVTPEFLRTGRYEVNAGGDVHPATVSLRPPFDPAATRVRPATPTPSRPSAPAPPAPRRPPPDGSP